MCLCMCSGVRVSQYTVDDVFLFVCISAWLMNVYIYTYRGLFRSISVCAIVYICVCVNTYVRFAARLCSMLGVC